MPAVAVSQRTAVVACVLLTAALPTRAGAFEGVRDAFYMTSPGMRVGRLDVTSGYSAGLSSSAFAPTAGARLHLATQEELGFDLSATVAIRTIGYEGEGAEVESRLVAARRIGHLALSANALVGAGIAGRDDVDLDATAIAAYSILPALQVGAQAHSHTEVVDDFKTIEDTGRPVEVLAGGLVATGNSFVQLQGLSGWTAPRGPGRPGPFAMITLAAVF
jgi:hypothetical protein